MLFFIKILSLLLNDLAGAMEVINAEINIEWVDRYPVLSISA